MFIVDSLPSSHMSPSNEGDRRLSESDGHRNKIDKHTQFGHTKTMIDERVNREECALVSVVASASEAVLKWRFDNLTDGWGCAVALKPVLEKAIRRCPCNRIADKRVHWFIWRIIGICRASGRRMRMRRERLLTSGFGLKVPDKRITPCSTGVCTNNRVGLQSTTEWCMMRLETRGHKHSSTVHWRRKRDESDQILIPTLTCFFYFWITSPSKLVITLSSLHSLQS